MLLPVGFAQVGKINATKHKVNHVYKSVCARAPLSALALTEYIWKRRKKNFSPRILNTFENWKLWWWWNAAEFFMLNHNFCAHPVKRTTLTLTHSFTFANSTRLFFSGRKSGIKAKRYFVAYFVCSTRKLKRLATIARFVGMRVAKILLKCFPIWAHSFFLNGRWAE